MELLEAYKANPCGTLSIPYWKNKSIEIPQNMRIVHEKDFSKSEYWEYKDEPYFRLFHPLEEIQTVECDDIAIVTAKREDIPCFVDVINQSYADLSVTYEQLMSYTQTEVYHPELWIMAVNKADSSVVGCGIADFATVSGKVNNQTSPEMLYRKCGFVGDDVWHILVK